MMVTSYSFAIVKHRRSEGAVGGVVGTLMTNLAFEHAVAALESPSPALPWVTAT